MARPLSREQDLQARADRVIPGGMYGHQSTLLLPSGFPQFYSRGEGARVWDADGNEYIDYFCAFGPNLLGYCHRGVEFAAAAQARLGDTLSGPSPVMVELAETMVMMVAHAQWAMFCKNGTDATSMGVAIARAHTRRRKILVAEGAYHGSAAWCTPIPTGTLPEDRAHQLTYVYNDVASLEAAAAAAEGDLAAILVSAFKHDAFVDQALPDPSFARRCREICDASGALLIVDDVRGGFRLARENSWSLVGVTPDRSAWGQAIANGHPISALLGNEQTRVAARSIYATGSFWFAAVPMAAALKTLELLRTTDYLERTEGTGRMLRAGLAEQAAAHGFRLRQTGPVQMPQILFEDDPDLRKGCCWTAEAARRGVLLHPWHNMFVSAALTEVDVRTTLERTDAAFGVLARQADRLQPHPLVAAVAAAARH
jgi:glutamate-1-semialdehyde 2,1-aminomutase